MTARRDPSEPIIVAPGIEIDPAELAFTYTRSGGPGGQNVNKVSTRVTLVFDVVNSPSLNDAQKERIGRMLGTRINRAGVLRIVSARHRTQAANWSAAVERFCELLDDTLRPRTPRVTTRVPRKVKRKRREDKARRARVKDLRRTPGGDD
jgi:ribosome-associated protein